MTSESVADAEQHVNSDDSIELGNNKSGSSTGSNNNNINGKLKVRRVPVKGIKQLAAGTRKKRAIHTQRDYLISSLNSSKNKQRQRATVAAPAPIRSSKHEVSDRELDKLYQLGCIVVGEQMGDG